METRIRSVRSLTAGLLVLAALVGCRKPPELTHARVRELIEHSGAFLTPMDRDLLTLDTDLRGVPSAKREFLKLEEVTVKPDGPFGVAGATATATFTWQWDHGPFARRRYLSRAKLNCASGTWKVYEDLLKHQLRASMIGGED